MHIAVVTHNIVSGDGQGRVNLALVRYLLRKGVNVTLIADTIDEDLLLEGCNWVPVQPKPLADAIDLIKVVGFRLLANRVLDRIGDRFDAVFACGVVLSRPHTLNAVHFAHGGWLRSPYHPAKNGLDLNAAYQWLFSALNDRWERATLRQAQRVVAVSSMVKDELVESGLSADTIDVIVNGVDLEAFHPGQAMRKPLGLPVEVPLALFVGDIRSPIKNPDGLVRALARVPTLHIAFVGSKERSPLPALAAQTGVASRVHFLGFRRDIPDLMRAADFFVLPSRRDSCPLVLLEALASGLPAVVSRRVGTYDLVKSGECGVVIEDPEDSSALANALELLTQNADMRDKMAPKARAVAKRHSWDKMALQYYDLLRDISEIEPVR